MMISERQFLQGGFHFDLQGFNRSVGRLMHYDFFKAQACTHTRARSCIPNHDDIVGPGDLLGKVLMICFLPMPHRWTTTDEAIAQAVSLLSSELRAFGAFELVIVFVVQPTDTYEDFSFDFPSFFIVASQNHCLLSEYLGHDLTVAFEPTGLLVNRMQRVVWHKPLNFLLEYGVEAFPFTPEKLEMISERDGINRPVKTWESLVLFLSYTPLPFPRHGSILRKNPGGGLEKLSLLELGFKCVGLYVCVTGNLIPTLDEIHKKCCDSGLEFEIILVYVPFKHLADPQLFEKRINSILEERKISWWVLPFVNWVSRRLWRLCHKDDDDRLIILDPKTNFVEFHGEAVIRHFGISAYPFSRELLHHRELERLKALTLESLLVYGSRDYVSLLGSDFSYPVPVAALQGKSVLLYLHNTGDHSDKTFDKVISYCRTKVEDPNFAVVFIALDKTSFNKFGSSYGMPWLVCPFDREHAEYITRTIFGKSGKFSTFVVFREDGIICSVRAEKLVCSSCPDFPFNDTLPYTTKVLSSEDTVVSFALASQQNDVFKTFTNFSELYPLFGEKYFFPDLPLWVTKPPEHDNSDDYEPDEYFAPVFKIDFKARVCEVTEYSNEIHGKIPNIDTSNFDVVSLLSADNRNYLVRNNSYGDEVKVESLRDKEYVMICCFFCPIFYNSSQSVLCRSVADVCTDLYETYGDSFEMVLVFKMGKGFENDANIFRHMLSGFHPSCLVVPLWDSLSRDYICCSLGFSGIARGLFVRAHERKVIWHRNLCSFERYGKDTFPFSEEVFQKTRREERLISWSSQSLDMLFCCSSTSKNLEGVDGSKTSIEQLKEKLVGVYACVDGDSIPFLHVLHEWCKAYNIEFEVVVVYFPFRALTNPGLFRDKINRALEKRKISWWVLPFKSWVSRRLSRLLSRPADDKLIIVGKGVVDPHGEYFIHKLQRLEDDELSPHGVPSDRSGLKRKVVDEFKSKYLGAV